MLDDMVSHLFREVLLEACQTLPVKILGKVWQRKVG
jgi:hypothetical protein